LELVVGIDKTKNNLREVWKIELWEKVERFRLNLS
jgi:hypothetical protein